MPDDKRTQLGPTGADPVASTATPAATPAPAATASSPAAKTSYLPPPVDPLLGALLVDRYLIERKLGEGGMGAVYLATHQLLEKQVALKVLHGEYSRKPDLVERFIQEAKAASRIRHENVIDISDFGTTPEGLVFFAMELLSGHDLHEDIARARMAGQLLPWERSKRIFLQICAALGAAHRRGIVHRDLKPENIYLVVFLGEPDFVKLLDFGIAKQTEVTEGERKLTKTGMLFGTPEYMSPEQARGETQIDHRVDIYAMGCILFQLVTGRVPFEAENFMGVLSLHLTELPPQIPTEVFDRIRAPRELANVIDKALEKDRSVRWQSIDDFANAVRVVCGDPPIAAGTTTMPAQGVPAPASTTSPPPPRVTPTPTPTPAPGSRARTQWTGALAVPQADDAAPRGRSKLPLILGGLLLAGGGAAVAIFGARGGGGEVARAPADAAVVAAAVPDAGAAVAAPSPDAAAATVAVEPPLPAEVTVAIRSTPAGATVRDAAGKSLGKTPVSVPVTPGRAPVTFTLALRGFAPATVTAPADRSTEQVAQLERDTPGRKPPPGTGSATTPPPGEPVLKPDLPDRPDKPPGKPDEDCEEVPCLKNMPERAPAAPPAAPPAPAAGATGDGSSAGN